MTSTLSGRTAVITGGARGIGLTLARALAAEGVGVAVLDLLDTVDDAAKSIADEFDVPTYAQRVEVTDQAAVADAFKVVRKRLGVPRVLVTAAGIEINGDSVKVTAEQWRKVIDVNLTGTFFSAQAFGEGLLNAGTSGSAVFIASMSGSIVNVPQWAASYNASGAAGDCECSLAVEWAPAGIRVNSVSPGYVLTDLTQAILDEDPALHDEWVARIPQGRMAKPEDLSGLVTFLASDASAYLTAQDIVIDGGYTAV